MYLSKKSISRSGLSAIQTHMDGQQVGWLDGWVDEHAKIFKYTSLMRPEKRPETFTPKN